MAYKTLSISRAVEDINKNHLFLPAIQRNFVWNRKRIEQYFDSIYRGFPLGNFIFWSLNNGLANRYPLYQFIREYNERIQGINPKPPRNLLNGDAMWAVVDGQQRLSSLYIGLTGTFRYKKSGKGLKDIEHNFISSRLYFNLFHFRNKDQDDSESPKLFSFRSDVEASNTNEKYLWVEVGKILQCKKEEDISNLLIDLQKHIRKNNKKTVIQKLRDKNEEILKKLLHLHSRFTQPLLSFYEVHEDNIDDVIEIFVRVNSGGMQLKKADLLFSTIAAEWDDARDKIDSLLESLEEYELYIDRDFVMRSALMLSDLPVKYKVDTFNKKNIRTIIKNWERIEKSLLTLAENLNQFGYKNFPNLSNNALIVIAYYISKGGDIKTKEALTNIKLYYVTAQVKNLFGGQNDFILSKIRERLRIRQGNEYLLAQRKFDFDGLKDLALPGRKTFKIGKVYIEDELVDQCYGANAYFLLSLLYPALDFKMKRFELDHIHPKRKMNASNLKSIGLIESEIEWFLDHYDNLPNLELLTSEDNNNKKAKPFDDFIRSKKRIDRSRFLKENYISTDKTLWELKNFRKFYEVRRKVIVQKLSRIFND